jgi:membrane protein YqaA with SNARE-associated domain
MVPMFGADMGTSLMAVVFSRDLSWLSPLFILVGVVLFITRQSTTVGRVGLVAISRVAGERMLGRWSRGNLEYLHGRLESAAGDLGVAVLLAASPPPAGVLFIVAGLVRVKLWLVAASVFVGRIIGYTISVGGGSLAATALADQLRGLIGPWSVVVAVAIVVGVLLIVLRIDYRALIEDHRLRIHRGRRGRGDDMPGGA